MKTPKWMALETAGGRFELGREFAMESGVAGWSGLSTFRGGMGVGGAEPRIPHSGLGISIRVLLLAAVIALACVYPALG